MSLNPFAELPSASADALDLLSGYVSQAWESFERPRATEPVVDEALRTRLSERLPATPGDRQTALADAVSVLESSVSPSRPLFLAYIGSSGLEAGVLAAALSNAYDVNLAVSAGAADALDAQTVRWMGEFVGYPAVDGHFTSGGQTSNLTAILAARERALPGTRKTGVRAAAAVYCSTEAHHSNIRAVEAAGLGSDAIRKIAVDEAHRMRADELDRALAADRAAGVVPVAVIATAGTTLTGAVDPIAEIAEVCERHGVWLHIDGAYGVPAAASSQAGWQFAGLDRADSVTVDAHKWMGLQKSCSLIMVRDPSVLLRTFGHDEQYMLHDHDAVNPVDRTFEYSRPLRALKLWMAFRLYGSEQYRSWIDHTLENAARFTEQVRADARFELLHEPQLSTICFRAVGAEGDLNTFNTELARAVQHDGRVFLAPATVDGMTCLRVCFVNFRTTASDVDQVLPVIAELADRLRA